MRPRFRPGSDPVAEANVKGDPAAARTVRAATGWKDLGAFEDLLVERLAGP